jgi:hypothetical protein
MEEEMDNAAEQVIELGLDDLEAISGGMSQGEYARLNGMLNKVSKW